MAKKTVEDRFYEGIRTLYHGGDNETLYSAISVVKDTINAELALAWRRVLDDRYRSGLAAISIEAGMKTSAILREVVALYLERRRGDGDSIVEYVYDRFGDLLGDDEKPYYGGYRVLSMLKCAELYNGLASFYDDEANRSKESFQYQQFTIHWDKADVDDVISCIATEADFNVVPAVVPSGFDRETLLGRIVEYVEKYLSVAKNTVAYRHIKQPEPDYYGFLSRSRRDAYLSKVGDDICYVGRDIRDIVRDIVSAYKAANSGLEAYIYRVFDFDGNPLTNDADVWINPPFHGVLTGLSCVEEYVSRGYMYVISRLDGPKDGIETYCRREEFFFDWDKVDVEELTDRVMKKVSFPCKFVRQNDAAHKLLLEVRKQVEFLINPYRNGDEYTNFGSIEYDEENDEINKMKKELDFFADVENYEPKKESSEKKVISALKGFLDDSDDEDFEDDEKEPPKTDEKPSDKPLDFDTALSLLAPLTLEDEPADEEEEQR